MARQTHRRRGMHATHTRRAFKYALQLEAMDERVLLSGVTASYAVQNDWGSGYQAQISLNNTQTTSVSNWQLQFDLPGTISSIWNAQVTQHVGNHYTVTGLSWDTNIAPSSTLAFGFVSAPGGPAPLASNYILNGVALGATSTPALTSTNATANVSASNGGTETFTVSLSQAATSSVQVAYTTADGTAKAGTDYTATSGTLVFAAGQTSKTISVPVLKNPQWKADSTFALNFSSPSGVTLGTTQAVGTIHNLNAPPATGSITFLNTSDWGSGFNGEIDIKNTSTTSVNNWSLAFDFSGTISSIWNATISSHVGTKYVVVPASWNNSIAPGATVSFGFTASPGGGTVAPTNFVLTPPISGGGGGGTTAKPPVVVNDTASTYQGQAVNINVLANDSDPNGLALLLGAVAQPKNGSVVINSDKTITYTPATSFTGSDTFTYTATDAQGGTATGTVNVTVLAPPAAPTWTAHEFSPYVDMTLYPTYNLVNAANAGGVKDFTLAFIVADSANKPAWGGYSDYEVNGGAFDVALRNQVTALRAIGGDVMVSFGGAANQELAEVIADVNALKNAYETVINAYGLTHIDFDIEGAAAADYAAIDRRSQALALVQKDMAAANKPLEVWLTLPVLPTGLTADGLYSVQSAVKYGVRLGGVNVMAMDYGESAAPNPSGQMGTYAIQAGTSLFNQLRQVYGAAPTDAQLWSMVGITPMIGLNDDTNEVFDLAAAQQLTTWAKQKGIGRIAMWSLNRDQQNPNGAIKYVETTSSSIVQQPYAFSKIFETFAG